MAAATAAAEKEKEEKEVEEVKAPSPKPQAPSPSPKPQPQAPYSDIVLRFIKRRCSNTGTRSDKGLAGGFNYASGQSN